MSDPREGEGRHRPAAKVEVRRENLALQSLQPISTGSPCFYLGFRKVTVNRHDENEI